MRPLDPQKVQQDLTAKARQIADRLADDDAPPLGVPRPGSLDELVLEYMNLRALARSTPEEP